MTRSPSPDLSDADIATLESLLDALPAPLEPLDVSALDGFLCGVLLQPRAVAPDRWLPRVCDLEGRPAPPGADLEPAFALARRRHQELDRAIRQRDWFDPWIFQLGDDGGQASPADCMLGWVAGFAAAQDAFGDLLDLGDAALVEPLALLYMHFDADDLEDAEALRDVIETLEPPADLAEAVQDAVRAVMLIADVTRPQVRAATTPGQPHRPPRPQQPHRPRRPRR